jgi:hypothetical protein
VVCMGVGSWVGVGSGGMSCGVHGDCGLWCAWGVGSGVHGECGLRCAWEGVGSVWWECVGSGCEWGECGIKVCMGGVGSNVNGRVWALVGMGQVWTLVCMGSVVCAWGSVGSGVHGGVWALSVHESGALVCMGGVRGSV